ncbi:AbrB family transcriptional regulator [Rhodococcus kroppenstedtii]|uniref:AbrB family transcriptional regulator n=1 Tax=Rhodococcoides kroppenstedtii TaxID=293050 RepID=UPI0029543C91|nr:AbrB family transcriptional regulator [Rhodococcus kroppenstedtii]MDV7198524.1 AbrB family transcriptional regulator [Rhodococcus kroppenstedtii]
MTRARTVAVSAARWVALTAVSVAGWVALDAAGLTAPSLFAALVVAVIFALTGLGPARVPRLGSMAAQGALAVTIGLMIDPDTLRSLGDNAIPAVLVGVATLVVSAGAGALLALNREVTAATGMLSLIAGGATGLVAAARELGGDERVVAVVQYLRVALVVVTMPLVITFAFHADTHAAAASDTAGPTYPWWVALGFVVAAVVVGIVVGRLLRLPAPATLGPLLVSGACALSGRPGDLDVPAEVLPVAFLIIGWQAGLAFTLQSLRSIGRLFPYAVALVVGVDVVCALFGWLLAELTGTSMLTGYLATTPGGLAAVLAVSASTGSDVTFVACVQLIRLVLMLIAAPVIATLLTGRASRRQESVGV